ncbi:MAG TPA: DnaJ domain-containing protein [Anaeromyxobacteraceae bacterium]|nr:DnaJ domain-containing protein [Anaeromyxobacteraceae bacterium]
MDETFRIEVETLAEALDHLDYFAILKVAQSATPAEIKAAYHRESRLYHPDRFAAVGDPHLRDLVGRVYRRINEAYTVLRDDARRGKYLADVASADRDRKLRFTETDEVEVKEAQKRKVEEQLGQTPNGRKFFSSALADIQAGRWEAAERNLKMALMYEPENPRFQEQMALVEKNRPKVDFRIK